MEPCPPPVAPYGGLVEHGWPRRMSPLVALQCEILTSIRKGVPQNIRASGAYILG